MIYHVCYTYKPCFCCKQPLFFVGFEVGFVLETDSHFRSVLRWIRLGLDKKGSLTQPVTSLSSEMAKCTFKPHFTRLELKMITDLRVDKPLIAFRYTHDVFFLTHIIGQATCVEFTPDEDFPCSAFLRVNDTPWGRVAVRSRDVEPTVHCVDFEKWMPGWTPREPCLTAQYVEMRIVPDGIFRLKLRDVPIPIPGVDQDITDEEIIHLKESIPNVVAW